jgi:hypothetical protein
VSSTIVPTVGGGHVTIQLSVPVAAESVGRYSVVVVGP